MDTPTIPEPYSVAEDSSEFLQSAYPIHRIAGPSRGRLFMREPVLRKMRDGSWICSLYSGGAREPHNENHALLTRSEDEGRTWTEPEVLFDSKTRAVYPTEIFTGGDEPLLFVQTFSAPLYYDIKSHIAGSADCGRTWTWPKSIPGVPANFRVGQGIVLGDGAWVFPVYWLEIIEGWDWNAEGEGDHDAPLRRWREQRFTRVCGVIRSSDRGASFSLHGNIRHPQFAMWENTLIERAPGHLLMLMRADGAGVLFRSESSDGGFTWSAPCRSDIVNPGSKSHLLKIGERIGLLHNPNPGKGMQARTCIELWLSDDGGATWPTKKEIVRVTKPGRIACYPNGEYDPASGELIVAFDTKQQHFLVRLTREDLSQGTAD